MRRADIVGGLVGDPHLFLLRFRAGLQDAAGKIFATGKNSQLPSRTGINQRGIGTDHFRSAADDNTVADDEVE